MFFRFRVASDASKDAEITFTLWQKADENETIASAQRIKMVTDLRAAQPDALISLEKQQRDPNQKSKPDP